MYVHYYMTAHPKTVFKKTSVADAAKILVENGIRHLPVVDEEGKLAGMVTDRDMRSAYPSILNFSDGVAAERLKVENVPVSEIMSAKTFVLRMTSTLDDAMLFFEKKSIGALPVLSDSEKVIGILSLKDLLKAWKSLFGFGEKGSFLIALEVESPDRPLSSLLKALEEMKIPFSRIIRTEGDGKEPAMIYLKVKTYNIISVHNAIEQAGFKVNVPDDLFEGS